VSVHVDPITLELHFQRLEFATGFDVRGLVEERDALRAELDSIHDPNHDLCPACRV
jgi:hypothetical protein